jgi:hypothetical protein
MLVTHLLAAYDGTTPYLAHLSCGLQSNLSNGMLENREHVGRQAEDTSSHHMFLMELKTQLTPFLWLSQHLPESPRISLCIRPDQCAEVETTCGGPKRLGFITWVCPILITLICDRHVHH